MSPTQLEAWTVALVGLVQAGIQITDELVAAWKAVMTIAHSDTLRPADIEAAWWQIRADIRVGLALAEAQSGGAA